MARKSHHFQGMYQYADKLMDLAEGQQMFSGRGQKPSNKDVVALIASIRKCRKGHALFATTKIQYVRFSVALHE
jgi:hypothetical protein